MTRCHHIPGTIVELDPDQDWSTCMTCGRPISRLFHDYDGDGEWHWSRWGLAPIPVELVVSLPTTASLSAVA